MGKFRLLYFANASSYTKKQQEDFDAPVPLSKLFEILDERYPGMKQKILSSCLVTINLEYVDVEENSESQTSTIIKGGDEVAIIPPVSSG
ncbi:MAG: hypothetical protein M1834_002498 [Cirrosporium novae-zelandiae]|nr:MAG: hypothetical protein M1834_002498 [Cirrosporium novae-zelandiae]